MFGAHTKVEWTIRHSTTSLGNISNIRYCQVGVGEEVLVITTEDGIVEVI